MPRSSSEETETDPPENKSTAEPQTIGRVQSRKRDLIACAVLIAVATLVILPAFFRGFPNGDDAYSYYRLAEQFDEAIREKGVIYPQWLGSANHGQGSPILL